MEHKILRAPLASFTDLLLDAVCMVDVDGRFVFVSAACERIFGYTQQEMVGMQMLDLVAPADRARTLAAARAIMDGHAQTHFENRYLRKDGRLVHIMWSARWSAADQLRVAVARDVSALKQAQAKQAALYAISEAVHAAQALPDLLSGLQHIIGEHLPAGTLRLALREEDGQPARQSSQADADAPAVPPPTPLAGLLCEEVLRSGTALQLPAERMAWLPAALRDAAGTTASSCLAVPLLASHGCIGALALQCTQDGAACTAQDQDLLQFVAKQLATAIERQQLQQRMHFMAMHDELTRLPNRRLFHDRLRTAFARAQRQQGRLSLLFLDLDHFKLVNDQHGHACGDLLLQAVAGKFKDCLRESDTLARLGGDEFVILVEHHTPDSDVVCIAQKIHVALAAPIQLGDGQQLPVAVSVGIAHYPEHGETMQQLLRHADRAMYDAKSRHAAS